LPAKTDGPVPDALIADGHAPCRQDQLDVPQTEAEAMIQPDRLRDNLRREPETAIRMTGRAHASQPATPNPTANLAKPCQTFECTNLI
jgi:hypothetical protein